jgi:pimeloyl-ACP methyl ester carboxylesterase
MYRLAENEYNRSKKIQSRFNYMFLGGGEEYLDRMGEIRVQATIFHGTDDPALPFEHGQALAKAIPHAELIPLEGTGHEIHTEDWDKIIKSIIKVSSK